MRRWLAAVFVALVLVVPVLASAECAWVLWEQERNMGEHEQYATWAVQSAWASKVECEGYKQGTITKWVGSFGTADPQKAPMRGAQRHADGFTLFADRAPVTFKYFCLPDTIDPRGPKGGGR